MTTHPRSRRMTFLLLTLLFSVIANFWNYEKINLAVTGPFYLDLIKYEDAARTKNWNDLIQTHPDPFVKETYADRDRMMVGYGLYNFCNLPFHFFASFLNLKGTTLWLSAKFLMASGGVLAAILVFLLADILYGPLVGFLAAVFLTFSPHIWITYHLDANLDRLYNLILSLGLTYSFMRHKKTGTIIFLILAGVFMGLNYLFFNIGSPMMPLILCGYSIILSAKNKNAAPLKNFALMLAISFASAVGFSSLHQFYLKLPVNPLLTWIKTYVAWGPTASHSAKGMVFLRSQELLLNTKNHMMSVFLNGKSADWHYMVSPPGVPMVYNYLISVFFLAGLFLALRRRKNKDIFLVTWFLCFFIVYCLIFMRPKNIIWELVPIFILAARALPVMADVIAKKTKFLSKKTYKAILGSVLILSSAGTGMFFVHAWLPRKNFYDGAGYMGTYAVHQFLESAGVDEQSKIVFTSPQILIGNMMLRLFQDPAKHPPEIINLSHHGILTPPDQEKWEQFETELSKRAKKAFYIFSYYENYVGHVYQTDETYRGVFEKIHPDTLPRVIPGLDGKPLWRIYEVTLGPHEPKKQTAPEHQRLTPATTSAPPSSTPQVASAQPQRSMSPPQDNARDTEPKRNARGSKDAFSDTLVGSTFKILAKSFVAVVNIADLKKYNIHRLKKMSDDKFRSRYEKVYLVLKDLPDEIKMRFGITEHMTREQAVQNTASLDKKAIYELLDAIPNHFIADKFRQYLREGKEEIQNSNIVVQIKNFWKKAESGAKIEKTH